jgi:hypothetical protein
LKKEESFCDVILNDKPETYKYKPSPMYSKGVLFYNRFLVLFESFSNLAIMDIVIDIVFLKIY